MRARARFSTVLPIATIGILALLLAGVISSRSDGYEVRVEFADAAGLRKNFDVKVSGVRGGRITKMELGSGDRAVATITLSDGVRIGAGARANVRPVNLLGEKYIELEPGDLSRPLPSGGTIPVTRTSAPVELDDVLNMLQPDTRAALRILINEAGVATVGHGADFNAVLDTMPGAIDRTRQVVSGFARDTSRLRRMVDQVDRVLTSVTPERDQLNRLVDEAGRALQVTADRRAELGTTVVEGAPTLRRLRRTLEVLDDTATELVPASHGLRETAGPLHDAIEQVSSFVPDTLPLLRTASVVSADLRRLGTDGAPVVRRLRPSVQRLQEFAAALRPVLDTADEGGALDGLLGLMDGWTKVMHHSDGLGHLFRLRLLVDQTLAGHIADRMKEPATTTQPRPAAGPQPRPAADPPTAGSKGPAVGPALPKLPVPALPGTTLDERLADPGKTVGDVDKLLDYLLGG